MPNLDFLDAKSDVFLKNDDAYAREERRLFGGDAVLTELVQWINESTVKYLKRQSEASWIGFPNTHASILAGHIVAAMPIPNFGTLGDVRKRADIPRGSETNAERFYYNCDGVGIDGTQLPAFVAGALRRAIAVGHEYTLVEMPQRARGVPEDRPVTQEEVDNGHRPFLVTFPARSVPYIETTNGRTDWLVIRTPVGQSGIKNGRWEKAPSQNGYYLLVREGYAGLGDEFSGGGWWWFDSDRRPFGDTPHGRWTRTKGQIPIARLVAEASTGTQDWPTVARSLTMELGQIAVSLMNRISERNFDASDAAKSVKFILGGDKDGHNLVVDMVTDGAIIVTVPAVVDAQSGQVRIPTIYDSSAGAVAADVFTTIINSTIAEAHEIMVRQLTSTADSSGRSKEVGFGEATSPLLASLAANVETWLNTLITFTEMRALGTPEPSGSVSLPREFEIAPVVEKIDRTIARMKEVGGSSATFLAKLIQDAATDDGTWPKDEAESRKARAELEASLRLAQRAQQALVFDTFAKSGAVSGAAKLATLTPAEAKSLSDVEEPVVENDGNGAVPPQNSNGSGRGVPVLTE